jgi:hypothetical protein
MSVVLGARILLTVFVLGSPVGARVVADGRSSNSMRKRPLDDSTSEADADLIANLEIVERLELLENLELFEPESGRQAAVPREEQHSALAPPLQAEAAAHSAM